MHSPFWRPHPSPEAPSYGLFWLPWPKPNDLETLLCGRGGLDGLAGELALVRCRCLKPCNASAFATQ